MRRPYESGKIPVVLIHGLLSDTLTWGESITQLEADPRIEERYHFWTYRYPTGESYLIAAADLRQQLVELRDLCSAAELPSEPLDNMVLVGHSMGGLVAKLQVTACRDELWKTISDLPVEHINALPEELAGVEHVVRFGPLPFVKRVVFIATPHGGAALADRPLGLLGRRLIEFPKDAQESFADLMSDHAGILNLESSRIPTSVDHLSPHSRVLQATQRLPYAADVHLHSIIGTDNGLALLRQGDGIVNLASAALSGVESECLVDAKHTHVHRHPETVDELKRILLEH